MNSFGFVNALAVFNDGSGEALYAGGQFTSAGGQSANRVARWNGSSWSALGSGVGSIVYSLVVFDDGSGPALFAGGSFTSAGGQPVNHIAKWDGTVWSPLGTGVNDHVRAMIVFDDGSGPALYVGGSFLTAGGQSASRIAKWNGSAWSPVSVSGINGIVRSLTVFDDGTGPALFVGGDYTLAGGVSANRIAKWNGSNWSALGTGVGSGLNSVNSLAVYDDGLGPALFAGGQFTFAGGQQVNRIAKWDGLAWSSLGSGITGTSSGNVEALAVFNTASGPHLYAGGLFTSAGGVSAVNAARWICIPPPPDLCAGVVCNSPPGACFSPIGVCNPNTGVCDYAQLPSGSICDDNFVCTQGSECDGNGVCGVPDDLLCNDGIVCTLDICDPMDGCANEAATPECAQFQCTTEGDVNGTDGLNVSDVACAILVVSSQQLGGPLPGCLKGPMSLADMNCSQSVDVSDILILIHYVLYQTLPSGLDLNDNGCIDTCDI